MEPIPNNSLTNRNFLNSDRVIDDIRRELYRHLSIDDILNLSATCKFQNVLFYRLIENTFLTRDLHQGHHPFLDFLVLFKIFFHETSENPIAKTHPEYREERFQACGSAGARHLRKTHQIESYYDRRKIAQGKSIESVKNKLAQKRAVVEDFASSNPEMRVPKKAVLNCVLDRVITINNSCTMTPEQIALVKKMQSKEHIARYHLTADQVRHIILRTFNPFCYEVIQIALARGWIAVDRVVGLRKHQVEVISTQRSYAIRYAEKVDKYPFLVTISKYNLTQKQVVKLIQISSAKGSPLFCFDELEEAVANEVVSLNQALEISHDQALMLLGQNGKALKKLIAKYTLSQEQTFHVIKYKARHLFNEETQWAVDEEVLTFGQAIRLRYWQQHGRYLRELQASIRRYNLTTEQVSKLLNPANAVAHQVIPFAKEIIQWGLEENLFAVDQAIDATLQQELFLQYYKKFRNDLDNQKRSPHQYRGTALAIAANLIRKIFNSQVRMESEHVYKLPFEFVTKNMMLIYSATTIDALVIQLCREHRVRREAAISIIFEELLHLSKQSI